MEFRNILYVVNGSTATITINRPERRNALDTPTYRELHAALDAANGDDTVRVLILTGSGDKAFASGADLAFVNELAPADYRAYLEVNQGTRQKIRSLDKPVIARLNGAATGGAMGLATACDLLVAANHVRMGQTEINVGLIGGIAHLWTAGRAFTAELMLTGRVISAQEAFDRGLINRVVPMEQLDQVVLELAQQLASKSPYALKLTKRALAVALDIAGLDSAVANQMELVATAFASDDRREGISAFLEKRQPNFTGR